MQRDALPSKNNVFEITTLVLNLCTHASTSFDGVINRICLRAIRWKHAEIAATPACRHQNRTKKKSLQYKFV